MYRLAIPKAIEPADDFKPQFDSDTSDPQESFAALGGEPLQGSGFDDEEPEPSLEDEEVL